MIQRVTRVILGNNDKIKSFSKDNSDKCYG